MKLNIMTYNIAGGRYYARDCDVTEYGGAVVELSKCGDVIKEISPDLCGMNEVNLYEEEYVKTLDGTTALDQTRFLAEYTGLENYYFGQAIHFDNRGPYGNSVISKAKVLSSEVIAIPDPEIKDESGYYETRGITKVKLDIAGGITVLQVHVGLNIAEYQNAVDTLCKVIDEADSPVILMGDFNMRPSNRLLDKIKERLQDITPDGEGYQHTFPSWNNDAKIAPALRDYRPCKIDYIFASKEFRKVSCKVHRVRVSDHMPLVATLEI